jgi:hypothetical protein
MEQTQGISKEQDRADGKRVVTRRSFSSEAECKRWVADHLPICLPAFTASGKLVYPFKSARCQQAVADILGQELWSHLTGG